MHMDHSDAIIRWRDQLDTAGSGLEGFEQSATISTMLFGCKAWLLSHGQNADGTTMDRIRQIEAELTSWLAERGQVYRG